MTDVERVGPGGTVIDGGEGEACPAIGRLWEYVLVHTKNGDESLSRTHRDFVHIECECPFFTPPEFVKPEAEELRKWKAPACHVHYRLSPIGTSAPVPEVTVAPARSFILALLPLFILALCSTPLPSSPTSYFCLHNILHTILNFYSVLH